MVGDAALAEMSDHGGIANVSAYPTEAKLRAALRGWVEQRVGDGGGEEWAIRVESLLADGLLVEAADLLCREDGYWWACYTRFGANGYHRVTFGGGVATNGKDPAK